MQEKSDGKGTEKDLTQRAQRLQHRGHGEFVLLLDGRIKCNFASSCLLQLRLWQRLAQIVLSLLQGLLIFLGSWLMIALDLRSG